MDDNLDSLLKLLKRLRFPKILIISILFKKIYRKVTHLIKVDIENNNINIEDDKIIKKINLVKDYIDSLEKIE